MAAGTDVPDRHADRAARRRRRRRPLRIRRVTGGRRADHRRLGALGALAPDWVLYERVLPFTGVLGFWICWYLLFAGLLHRRRRAAVGPSWPSGPGRRGRPHHRRRCWRWPSSSTRSATRWSGARPWSSACRFFTQSMADTGPLSTVASRRRRARARRHARADQRSRPCCRCRSASPPRSTWRRWAGRGPAGADAGGRHDRAARHHRGPVHPRVHGAHRSACRRAASRPRWPWR